MTVAATSGALEAARQLLDIAIEPVNLRLRSKEPHGNWPAVVITADNVADHFGATAVNIGVNLGRRSSGLTDVDCDCEEAARLAPLFLPPTNAVFGRASRRAAHHLYVTDLYKLDGPATTQFNDIDGKVLIELRTGAGDKAAQTMVPPSVHPSGELVSWEPGKTGKPSKVDSDKLKRAVQKVAAATLLVRHCWYDGLRHQLTQHLAGFLARLDWTEEETMAFVTAIAEVAGDPDVKDRQRMVHDTFKRFESRGRVTGFPKLRELVGDEVSAKLAAILGYGTALEVVDRMNAEYAVIQDGGRVRVLRFDRQAQLVNGQLVHTREVPTFLGFGDVRNFHLNEIIAVTEKPVSAGDWWLRHPQRRTYTGITFQPHGPEVVDGRLNLWRGWGVAPAPGDWSLMREHIERVLANHDATAVDYIMKWLAWTVQHPDQRAEVALVLRGGRGTGKGTLGNAFCRIFGQHATHISSAEHLGGRFNAHMRDVVFLFADESYWPGDKSAEGTLKRLITEPDLFIEAKGRDGVYAPNMLHVFMAANDAWVVPAGEHERRFAMFDVSEDRRQDQGWFGPLYAQLEAGGLAAMLYDLLRLNLADWHPRKIPMTAALRHQQLQSLQPLDKWIDGLLQDGVLPGKPGKSREEDDNPDVGRSRTEYNGGLFDLARRNVPGLQRLDDQVLAAHLKEQVGCESWRDGQVRGWRFPPLAECRAKWEVKYPGWHWRHPELDAWTPRVEEGGEEGGDEPPGGPGGRPYPPY